MELSVLPETLLELEGQGWSAGRRVDVTSDISQLRAAGYVIDEYMELVLGSLGGLVINPVVERGVNYRNDEPLVIDPVGAGVRHLREAIDLELWHKVRFCPLGWWLCASHVFFSSAGIVVASVAGVVWEMGENLGKALDFVVTANRPLVRLWSLDGMGVD